MTDHMTYYSENDDDDGEWWSVTCLCGWSADGLPDMETAADCGGDHRVAAAVAEERARCLAWSQRPMMPPALAEWLARGIESGAWPEAGEP